MDSVRNPDIQRLLANLRNGTVTRDHNQAQSTSSNTLNNSLHQQPPASYFASIPSLGLLPSKDTQSQVHTPIWKPATPVPFQPSQPSSQTLRPENPPARPSTPAVPDASTITTWPAALKHVTKHIATNGKAVSKIKHLISEQRKHERQWWTNREAIVARHSGRAGNQAKVADLLKSLGGASVPVTTHDPKADQAELEAFDKKVYRSLADMTADFDRQLRGFQVPFFAIKHDLVILEEGSQKEGATKGRVDKGELRELQRRMLETLEDLFGDD